MLLGHPLTLEQPSFQRAMWQIFEIQSTYEAHANAYSPSLTLTGNYVLIANPTV